MNKYESVFIIKPIEEEKIKEVIDKVKNVVEEFSDREVSIEEFGMKRLAYEINKNKEGYYTVINFYGTPEDVKKLERVYRITDEIMKFIVVRNEQENYQEEEPDYEE